jgi:hypothetical protein
MRGERWIQTDLSQRGDIHPLLTPCKLGLKGGTTQWIRRGEKMQTHTPDRNIIFFNPTQIPSKLGLKIGTDSSGEGSR